MALEDILIQRIIEFLFAIDDVPALVSLRGRMGVGRGSSRAIVLGFGSAGLLGQCWVLLERRGWGGVGKRRRRTEGGRVLHALPEFVGHGGADGAFHGPLAGGVHIRGDAELHGPWLAGGGGLDQAHGGEDIELIGDVLGHLWVIDRMLGGAFHAVGELGHGFAVLHGDLNVHHGAGPLLGEVGDHTGSAVGDVHHLSGRGAQASGAQSDGHHGALDWAAGAIEADVIAQAELTLGNDEEPGQEIADHVLRAETNGGRDHGGGKCGTQCGHAQVGEREQDDEEESDGLHHVDQGADQGQAGLGGLFALG